MQLDAQRSQVNMTSCNSLGTSSCYDCGRSITFKTVRCSLSLKPNSAITERVMQADTVCALVSDAFLYHCTIGQYCILHLSSQLLKATFNVTGD